MLKTEAEKQEQFVNDLKSLNQATEIFNATSDQKLIITMALRMIKEKLKIKDLVCVLFDEASKDLTFIESNTYQQKREGINTIISENIEFFRSIVSDDQVYTKENQHFEAFKEIFKEENLLEFLVLPLQAQQHNIGFIICFMFQPESSPKPADLEYCQTLLRVISSGIKNINLKEVIEEQNVSLEKQIKEKTKSIRSILDNSGQGFLVFDDKYRILPEYSKICELFLDETLANKNVFSTLFRKLGSKKAEQLKELFEMIFQETCDFDLIKNLLPSELKFDQNILSVEFKLLKHEQEEVEELDLFDQIDEMNEDSSGELEESARVLVILTDITREVQLSKKMDESREIQERLLKVASEKKIFIEAIQDVQELYLVIYQMLALPAEEIDLQPIMRALHTIKGTLASFRFQKVVDTIHDTEELLVDYSRDNALISAEISIVVINLCIKSQSYINNYLDELSEVLPNKEDLIFKTEGSIEISKVFLKKQISKLIESLKSRQSRTKSFQILNELVKQPLDIQIKKLSNDVQRFAEKTGKEITFKYAGEGLRVDQDYYRDFFNSLIHLIRNCVDHGIETQEQRKMGSKPVTGAIFFEAHENEGLEIIIGDDGKGVDVSEVAKKAIEKGFYTKDQIDSMSENEIAQIIFEAGFSTKDFATDLSGRGIGMDSVLYEVKKLRGKINIETHKGKGTKFNFQFPPIKYHLDHLWKQAETRILILEDSIPTQHLIKKILAAEKFQNFFSFTNGEEASNFIDINKVDIALLDINVPGMDGMAVLRKIRERFNHTELPVILITAREEMAFFETALELDVNDYILKPFKNSEVVRKVNDCLDAANQSLV